MSDTALTDPVLTAYSDDDERARTQQAKTEVASAKVDVPRVALIVLAVLAVFYTLYFAAGIILPVLFAAVINLLLSPAKRFLTDRLRLPLPLAAFVLLLGAVGLVAGIAYAISVPASGWIAKAPESLPLLQEKLGFLARPFELLSHGMDQVQHAMDSGPAVGTDGGGTALAVKVQQPTDVRGVSLSILNGTRSALAEVFTLIVLLFFFLAGGDSMLRRAVEIIPSWGDKRKLVEIAGEVERNVAGYLATITLMNLIVGIANGISMWVQGLPDPLLWGTVAFLLNYIPILGPFTGVAIFFVVGLFSLPTAAAALVPPGIYLLIHIIEGETVTPMLLARRFTLNPVLVIVALFFWDFLWGIPGALLAVPLLAIFKIVCDRIPSLTPFGHLLGTSPKASLKVPVG